MRSAISPRFAIRIFSNMPLGLVDDQKRFAVIDATLSIDAISEKIWEVLKEKLDGIFR